MKHQLKEVHPHQPPGGPAGDNQALGPEDGRFTLQEAGGFHAQQAAGGDRQGRQHHPLLEENVLFCDEKYVCLYDFFKFEKIIYFPCLIVYFFSDRP
jgi:hypothetical protein